MSISAFMTKEVKPSEDDLAIILGKAYEGRYVCFNVDRNTKIRGIQKLVEIKLMN